MDISESYVFCKEFGVTSAMLFEGETFPTIPIVKNGLVMEMLQIRNSQSITWKVFATWIKSLFQLEKELEPWGLQRSAIALKSTKQKLQKSSKKQEIDSLLQQPFLLPQQFKGQPEAVKPKAAMKPEFMQQAVQTANKSLACELIVAEDKYLAQKEKYEELQEKREQMERELQHFNPHNVKRREKRKVLKIEEQKETILQLEKELKTKQTEAAKNATARALYFKKKCKQLQYDKDCLNCADLEEKYDKMRERNIELLQANAELTERIKKLEDRKLTTFKDGKYTDDVRLCMMELLAHNVATRQVEPVIKAVLKLADIKYEKLPKHTIINEMLIESRCISQVQLAEVLSVPSYNTLHTDGTTKFGHKYNGYQVSTNEGFLTLGIQEVCFGTAQTELTTLQDILEELSEAASHHGFSDAGKQIVASLKSTMSDRASTEKAFNKLIASYRAEILPDVVRNWKDLTTHEKNSMARMYHFFCGMHMVVGMADNASESLKLFETNHESHEDGQPEMCSEAGTVRLIRTACKAFEKRGDEKSGCALQFTSYLKRQGIAKNPLVHFRGNRFNVLFANGGRVYFLYAHMLHFLNKVWGTPNRLLKAVLHDASCDLYIAGCKALGLIDKHITGPLWRLLESDIHILEMTEKYSELQCFLENCNDVTTFMTGEYIPFPATPIKKDDIWLALVTPSPLDPLVAQILMACFKSLELFMDRMLQDHLQETKSSIPESFREETVSVSKTNTGSERDFAQLDRLLREKPHASTLALEAHILFLNNKTATWIESKSSEERSALMTTLLEGQQHNTEGSFESDLFKLRKKESNCSRRKKQRSVSQKEK